MKQPLKVVLVTRDYPPKVGGIPTYAHQLFKHLQMLGVDVSLSIGGGDIRTLWLASKEKAQDKVIHVLSAPYGAFAQEERLILTVQEPVLDELKYYPMARKLKGLMALWLEKRALKKARRIIAVSGYIARRLKELGARGDIIKVVHHAPDPRLLNVEKSRSDKVKVLISARLDRRKNIDEALRALALIDSSAYELAITGNGPERRKLEGLAHRLKVPARFLGSLSFEELLNQYTNAHILLSTSRSEGFGLSILEGMAAGCAVVASNIPAHLELIEHEKDGIIYTRFEELVEHLKSLVEDRKRIQELGERSRAKARNYSWLKTAEATLNIYKELVR